MPKIISVPQPHDVGSLLSDFLCSPIAMRSDRLSAFVLPLIQQLSPRATPEQVFSRPIASHSSHASHPKRLDLTDDDGDEDPVMPWDEPIYDVDQGVAVLKIEGPIVKGYENFIAWYYGCASSDRIEQALGEIAQRDDVLACVLLIRSPGGMATGTPEVASAVSRLRMTKMVVAVTDTMACSAAYWMGCAAGEFFTTASADVGCIGTYIALYDYTKMLEEYGIKLELFKRGKYKAIGVTGNPLDKDARAFLDRDCGRTNDRFLNAVRTNRTGVANSTMEGQWFDGHEAVELKLADRVVLSVADVVGAVRGGVIAALSAAVVRI